MKPIYNTDIPVELWRARFSLVQLKTIAKQNGVRVTPQYTETDAHYEYYLNHFLAKAWPSYYTEKDKATFFVAYNLHNGIPARGVHPKQFEMQLFVA